MAGWTVGVGAGLAAGWAAVLAVPAAFALGLATGFFLAAFCALPTGGAGVSCAADGAEDKVAPPAIRHTSRRPIGLLETGRITSNLMIACCLTRR